MSSVRIGKLRLKNFKSFKKGVIPFSKGFTTIAGANGSGSRRVAVGALRRSRGGPAGRSADGTGAHQHPEERR